MGAKKGNQDWKLRTKHGPDFIYDGESLKKEFDAYLEHMKTTTWFKNEAIKGGDMAGTIVSIPMVTPLSIESFCVFADISRQTFLNYEKGDNVGDHQDLVEVATHIREVIETQQFEGASVGAFNPSIMARKLGLSEKTDVTTKGESINQPPIINLNINSSGVELAGSEDDVKS